MITLRLLRWSNCFSYGEDNELRLDQDILAQIIGVNGTGKSSIPLILEEVLFNKNSAGKKKASIPNRYAQKGYWINLQFDKDRDEYEIDVNRKTSIKVKLFKNGVDISSHTATNTYKTLQEIIGVDFKTFSQLVYQSTNASLQFLTATDTNRKKFLIDLLQLEEYVRLFEIFKTAAKELVSEITGYTSTIATIEKWLQDNKLEDTNILPMLNLDIDTSLDEEESHDLTTEIANISDKNKKINTNNQYRKLLEAVDLTEISSIKATQKLSYDHLQTEVGEYNSSKTTSSAVLAKMQKLGDTCHVCSQVVSPEFKTNAIAMEEVNIAVANAAIEDLTGSINEIKQNNRDFTRKNAIQKNWEDLYRSVVVDLPTLPLDVVELRQRLGIVRTRIQDAREQISKTAKSNEERTKRNTRIVVILEQTDAFINQLNIAQEFLGARNDILSNLEVLKKAFSTNGLVAYKIENQVKDLEELVNLYLADLSDGQFTLQFIVSNDKLNVEITDDGYVVDILDLSTGQLARVNTATLLAIRKLMSSISKSRINVLFLDEVISVLDEEGKEKLVEVLLREEDLNTFAVAHAWTHPLLERITVLRDGKTSYLEI